MSEPTRPMPNPAINPEGHWEGMILFSPEALNTRALFTLERGPVIPVILVPGIMGHDDLSSVIDLQRPAIED